MIGAMVLGAAVWDFYVITPRLTAYSTSSAVLCRSSFCIMCARYRRSVFAYEVGRDGGR
jgi:hypothetical protein